MSKYTTEVRYICEKAAGLINSKGFDSIEDKIVDGTYVFGILTMAAENIFNFDFPIFDENYRLVLLKKILRHYYTREICEETVGLWKLRMCDRLNMIMPYYNQMYQSELLKFNPLYDVDISRSHSGRKDNEENNTSTSVNSTISKGDVSRSEDSESKLKTGKVATGKTDGNTNTSETSVQHDESGRWDKYSDTAQGAVTGLANGEYLTNARNINDTKDNSVIAGGNTNVKQDTVNTETGDESSSGNVSVNESSSGNVIGTDKSKSTNTVTGLESYIERVTGKQGTISYSKMLMEFRETFLNIDAMIIEELSDLFFGLW